MINIAEETLDFRRSDFSSDFTLLIPTFALLFAPPLLTLKLHRKQNAPLPRRASLPLGA